MSTTPTPNTENRSSLLFSVAMSVGIVAAIALFFAIVFIYLTFGAALAYGYVWLAGGTPIFELWSFWSWTAPILLVYTIVFSVLFALRLDNLSWPARLAAGALPIIWVALPILLNAASKFCAALGLAELDRAFSNLRADSFWLMLAGLVAFTIVTFVPHLLINDDFITFHPTDDEEEEDGEDVNDHKPSQRAFTSDDDPKLPEIFIQ